MEFVSNDGKKVEIKVGENILKDIIKDNPAGQGNQTTPLILIRKKNEV